MSANSVPQKIVLPNGIRLLVDSDARFNTASLCFCLLGGLRSEPLEQLGVTHLLEHLLFKRTAKRTPFDIARSLDRLGGAANGFTDAEMLCLHADIPASKVPEALELFADMLRSPEFTREDFEKEREVVRQEMLELLDDPADTAYRGFCELLWPQSLLAKSVCGDAETLRSLSPTLVREYLQYSLSAGRVLIAVGGGVDVVAVQRDVERLFAWIPSGEFVRPTTPRYGNGIAQVERSVSQVHFIIGAPWPHLRHAERIAAEAVVAVLGEGMSARFFQRLREERGLVYDVECSSEAFVDTAAFEIAGVVDPKNCAEVFRVLLEELQSLRRDGVSEDELAHILAVYEAELGMEADSPDARLWRAIECELLYGHYVSAEEDFKALSAVRQEQCRSVCERFLVPGRFVASFAGDVRTLEIHEQLRTWCADLQ